jgi:hypothetical protein
MAAGRETNPLHENRGLKYEDFPSVSCTLPKQRDKVSQGRDMAASNLEMIKSEPVIENYTQKIE